MTLDDRERLGRYELLEEIGRGAMGVVYLAQDPLIGRQVALKVFRVGFSASDDELRGLYARFIREAQSAGILSHPNIVTVHDVAQADGEVPAFIAMEYVEGRTLKEILDSPEPVSQRQAIEYVVQIAAALEYAHSMGVVHRDIKPGNILITPDDKVKITDFGIALVNAPNITNHGQLLGTPNYMAPEAIEDEEVDHRADLFSLGVVLYELLTRHKPFAGRNTTAVTHRIVYEPFTPVTEYVRDLPDHLVAAVGRALEKKPERRFQSAAEMSASLVQDRGEETFPHETREIGVAVAPVSPVDTQSVEVELSPPGRGVLARVADWLGRSTPVGNVPLWLLLGGIAAGIGLGYLLSRTEAPREKPIEPTPVVVDGAAAERFAPLARRAEALEERAREHLADGDLESAYYALSEAVRLEPTSPKLERQLTQVEAEVTARREAWQLEVSEQLAAGWRSLSDGRIRDARQFADLAIGLDPMSLEAPELIARVEEERARIAARRRATPTPPPAPPPEETAEEPVERVVESQPVAVAEPAPVPTTGFLVVRLETARSPGVLTVYSGETQVFRERFRFTEKKGFLRSLAAKPGGGTLEEALEMDAGDLQLRVYVSLKGGASQAFRLQGELVGGTRRTLLVTVDEGGTARTALQ